MKLETFFEKFDIFADAPGAVGKIRELVWQLAVQGKLVPQHSAEEPANVLLEQILKAKARLPGNRRPGEATEVCTTDDEPVPYPAPSGWVWTQLGTVQVFTNGYAFKSEDYRDSGVGIIRMGELGANGEIDETNMKYVSPHIADSLPETFRVKPGDLLMGMSGSIGKLAINRSGNTYLLNQRVGRLEPVLIEKAFLQVFLKTVEQLYLKIAFGMAIKNLSTKQINETPFPLPPLAEQKRIVAKVDELMAMCDRLEAQLQERDARQAELARASLARFAEDPTPENLQFLFHTSFSISPADLRKTILTLAVQGKLVPQDPNDEPAEVLISRIAAIRRVAKAKAYAPVTEEEAFFEVPGSWAWVRLGNISLTSESGWSPQCHSESREGKNWGVLKVSAVSWGVFKPEENKALPPGIEPRPDCEVRPGDFLLSRANTEELVARSVVVNQTPPRLMMSDKIVRFTFPSEIEKAFINLANSSNPSRSYYTRNASGTSSSMKNIGREVMCNLPIPLPPLAEQRRIVAKVDELMTLVDALETQLATARATAADLLAAAVAEALVKRT